MDKETKDLLNIDIEGLEDVAASIVGDKGQTVKKQPEKQPEKPIEKTEPKAKEPDYAQFKTPEDILNAYKEVQGYSTKVSQKNKELEAKLEEVNQKIEELELGPTRSVPDYVPQQETQSFIERYENNPEETISQMVLEKTNMLRIADVLEDEGEKNPQEYLERYAYVNQLKVKHPHLAVSPSGVRKLFKMADDLRDKSAKRQVNKALELLDLDPEKLKQFKRDTVSQTSTEQAQNLTYMEGDTTRTGPKTKPKINYGQMTEEAVSKADVGTVLDIIFEEKMEK